MKAKPLNGFALKIINKPKDNFNVDEERRKLLIELCIVEEVDADTMIENPELLPF